MNTLMLVQQTKEDTPTFSEGIWRDSVQLALGPGRKEIGCPSRRNGKIAVRTVSVNQVVIKAIEIGYSDGIRMTSRPNPFTISKGSLVRMLYCQEGMLAKGLEEQEHKPA